MSLVRRGLLESWVLKSRGDEGDLVYIRVLGRAFLLLYYSIRFTISNRFCLRLQVAARFRFLGSPP